MKVSPGRNSNKIKKACAREQYVKRIGRSDGCFVAYNREVLFYCSTSASLRISTWSGTMYRWTLWIDCHVSLKQMMLMRLNYFMESVAITH